MIQYEHDRKNNRKTEMVMTQVEINPKCEEQP